MHYGTSQVWAGGAVVVDIVIAITMTTLVRVELHILAGSHTSLVPMTDAQEKDRNTKNGCHSQQDNSVGS